MRKYYLCLLKTCKSRLKLSKSYEYTLNLLRYNSVISKNTRKKMSTVSLQYFLFQFKFEESIIGKKNSN